MSVSFHKHGVILYSNFFINSFAALMKHFIKLHNFKELYARVHVFACMLLQITVE